MLSLHPALDADRGFCESLSRSNMAAYRAARGEAWDPQRFLDSWREFENLLIHSEGRRVGVLRLLAVEGALEIRDLQLAPDHIGQGIGSWAIEQAMDIAARRGIQELRLRVFEENPARRLYTRLGFTVARSCEGVMHMTRRVPHGR